MIFLKLFGLMFMSSYMLNAEVLDVTIHTDTELTVIGFDLPMK
jgi:hypothetical protein